MITIWEAIQKRSHEPIYKNLSKEIKKNNFCYRKVGRAITKWGAIEKSPVLFRILMAAIIFSPTVHLNT